MDRNQIRKRLSIWLIENDMPKSEFADRLGVSKQTVSCWVNGSRSIPLDRAVQICDLFGKPLDELACREPKAS